MAAVRLGNPTSLQENNEGGKDGERTRSPRVLKRNNKLVRRGMKEGTELIKFEKCKVTEKGLILDDSLTYEEWQGIGLQLQIMHSSSPWWIGDWIRFGEKKWGDKYTQAIEETKLDYGTLRDYVWVANIFNLSVRTDKSWFAHRRCAESSNPIKMMDKAVKEGLNTKEIREEVQAEHKQEKIDEFKKLSSGFNNKEIQIFNEPFQEYAKKIADNSIDLILTDPPYPIEFLPLWEDMFAVADRILKPSHFLVTYANHQNLDEIFRLKNNLKYYWTFKLDFTLKPMAMGRNLIATWKPVLIYQKLPFKKVETTMEDNVKDHTPFNNDERDMHTDNWGQSIGKVEYLIDKFSKPNDLIFEPFAGTGTTLIAAQRMKRKCIGTEIDKQYIDLIKGRVNAESQL